MSEILNIMDFMPAFWILVGATVVDLSIVGVAFKDFLSKGDTKEEKKDEKDK